MSRRDLEEAVVSLQKRQPHVILAFLPDRYTENDEEWGTYDHFKQLTLGRGIPGPVVYASTLRNRYAMANIELGVLGKAGNIPYVLAEPLSYADVVVGIDIARERKRCLPGSISATAIARIYFSDGQLLRYVIYDTALEGETVPDHVL